MSSGKLFYVIVFYIILGLSIPFLAALTIFLKIQKYFKSQAQNETNISGEVAVITGSARGLGRQIAIELAKRGCRIAVVDIRAELAQETAEYLAQTYGVKAKAYQVDVSDYQQLVQLQQNVTNDLGHTTILVNNAGILLLPLDPKPEDIQKMINVNFTAVYFANKIFLPKMKELNRGQILTISSITALFTCAELEVYAACKSAVRSLATAMRMSLLNEKKNIKSTTVMPYFLNSNKQVQEIVKFTLFPKLMPVVDSEEAARIAVEAMLDGEEELTIQGYLIYLYKAAELFSAAAVDRVAGPSWKWLIQNALQRSECKEIMEDRDTLRLL